MAFRFLALSSRCGGVLEAVRISCAGFPCKQRFEDFAEHFKPLAPSLSVDDASARDITDAVLARAVLQGAQLGKTKVRGFGFEFEFYTLAF